MHSNLRQDWNKTLLSFFCAYVKLFRDGSRVEADCYLEIEHNFFEVFTGCFVQILKPGAKIMLGFRVGVITALHSSFITIINLLFLMRRHDFHDIIIFKIIL